MDLDRFLVAVDARLARQVLEGSEVSLQIRVGAQELDQALAQGTI